MCLILQGPAGPQGNDGAAGPPGRKGFPGDSGPPGEQASHVSKGTVERFLANINISFITAQDNGSTVDRLAGCACC